MEKRSRKESYWSDKGMEKKQTKKIKQVAADVILAAE